MGGRGAGRSYETSQKIVAGLVQSKRPFRAAIMRAVHADIGSDIGQLEELSPCMCPAQCGRNRPLRARGS